MSSLLANHYETPEKHLCRNVLTPTCDVTMHEMVVPYSSNVCENNFVHWNVWIHRLPRENVSTMSPALVGRNFSSVDILLTFTLSQYILTLLNNLSETGASSQWRFFFLQFCGQTFLLNWLKSYELMTKWMTVYSVFAKLHQHTSFCRCLFKGLRPVLEGFVVPMHEGACETGSQIPRA